MAVVRILFLAKYRVPHAIFSLQWDHFLEGIDYTIVATPMPKAELWPVFDRYQIDTSNWHYICDDVIYQRYPEVNNWVFPDDYRTYWLRQQAIKLSYLDLVGEDVMLMHDPDTFMIEPYRCYQHGQLNLMTLMDTTQGSYEGVFRSITGLERPTPHCFVTELVPVRARDWQRLQDLLQQRWPGRHWLDAIIDAVPGMPTRPPWGNGNIIKWFSEYELLGGWAVLQGDVQYQAQRRFEYDSLHKLANLDPGRFNAVCDAVPDLSLSMQFDWQNLEVRDFDHWVAVLRRSLGEI